MTKSTIKAMVAVSFLTGACGDERENVSEATWTDGP